MDEIVAHGEDTAAKTAAVVDAFSEPFRRANRVLDVGSRDGQLERAMRSCGCTASYAGVDLAGRPGVRADLDAGLPFREGSFDVVVALDVLEHIEGIHGGIRELARVSRGVVIVSLPNLYDVKYRVAHALGRPLSGKYGLPAAPVGDRHRWFFSLTEARGFVRAFCEGSGTRLAHEAGLVGPWRARWVRGGAARYPALLAPTYVAGLETVGATT